MAIQVDKSLSLDHNPNITNVGWLRDTYPKYYGLQTHAKGWYLKIGGIDTPRYWIRSLSYMMESVLFVMDSRVPTYSIV